MELCKEAAKGNGLEEWILVMLRSRMKERMLIKENLGEVEMGACL